jgi:voltage-gated potassium channel
MPLLLNTFRAIWTLRCDQHFKSLAFLSTVAIVSGTVFYSLVEDLRVIDALYFSVVTLATVGYGDFAPRTDAGKLFTVFYVLIGVGILLSFVTRVAGQAVQSHVEHQGPAREPPTRDDPPADEDEMSRRRAA